MKDKQATTGTCAKAPAKAAYKKPVVKEFGAVGNLTQGGTGPDLEASMMGAGMGNPMQMP